MIIRIIPVRILILLSLQGKGKVGRNTPCSCLASLVPLGGVMLLAVVLGATKLVVMLFKGLGTSRMWWNTPDPSGALGVPCPSLRNPRFAGNCWGCAAPMSGSSSMQEGVFHSQRSKVDEIPPVLG